MIADFANGEISQASSLFDCDITIEKYKARPERVLPEALANTTPFPWRKSVCPSCQRDAFAVFLPTQEKSFFKTASLIAASCKSAAVFSGVSEEIKNDMYEYGKHLGLAFQVVDDILDFTQSTEQLGKPQGQDLATGNLTAPVIYCLQEEPALRDLIETRFQVGCSAACAPFFTRGKTVFPPAAAPVSQGAQCDQGLNFGGSF